MQLEDIYRAYEAEVADVSFHCRKGCATCCTRSVNITTAEGERILHYLRGKDQSIPDLDDLENSPPLTSTTNNSAAFFLEKKLPQAEESQPWNFLPCLFLEDDVCTIYPVRPFGCRSFGSLSDCRKGQSAEAPEWFITLNLFIMQIVEQLDHKGSWGNMFEILAYLKGERGKDKLLKNENIPGFLVPEGDRLRVISYLARLKESLGEDRFLKQVYEILGRSIKGE